MRFIKGLVIAYVAALGSVGHTYAADDYPTRPIRLIVPFAPGGGTTIMARLVSDQLSAKLGQPIVIENRDGAGGTTGTTFAARAAGDGYTWLLAHSGTIAIAPHLYSKIAYDPLKDFVPIGLIAQIPLVLVVSSSVPANSMAELIQLAKKSPGKLSYASGGVGTGGHLAAALFASVTGINITHIPYRGSGPTIPDLLSGRVDMSLGPVVPFLPHMATGNLRALGITAAERSPLVPTVPTMREAGVPNYETALFYGIVTTAGTPQRIVDRVSMELKALVSLPETKVVVEKQGGSPLPVTSAEYKAIMIADHKKWGDAVRISGAKVND